jgi:CRISPR/Cas system-associated endonuclease Cas1
VISIERGYRQLVRYQQDLSALEKLIVAQRIVQAKLLNSRVILQRQQRRRSPLVDALVLQLINKRELDVQADFEYRNGGCFLAESGRRKWLKAFIFRMEELLQTEDGTAQPRWDLLNRQVKAYKQFVYSPAMGYKPYRIR